MDQDQDADDALSSPRGGVVAHHLAAADRGTGYVEALGVLLLAAADLFIRPEAIRRFINEVVHALQILVRSRGDHEPDLASGYWQ